MTMTCQNLGTHYPQPRSFYFTEIADLHRVNESYKQKKLQFIIKLQSSERRETMARYNPPPDNGTLVLIIFLGFLVLAVPPVGILLSLALTFWKD